MRQLQHERDRYLAERDRYLAERNQLQQERDEERERRMPDGRSAALHAALTKRNAYLEQRNQAYREIDDLSQERNRLKGVINRLGRQFALEIVSIGTLFDEMRAVIERECQELLPKTRPATEPNGQYSASTSGMGNG